mgnify:CR=1 FL=1
MKIILSCIMFLATFVTANTCSEMIIKNTTIFSYGDFYRDSSYFLNRGDNAWTHKYYWSEGKLDSMVYDPMEDGEAPKVFYFYWNTDKSSLKGAGAEQIVAKETSGDTVIYKQEYYSAGELEDSVTTKITKGRTSSLAYSMGAKKWTLTETYLSNDTLYHKDIYGYNSGHIRCSSLQIRKAIRSAWNMKLPKATPRIVETIEYAETEKGFVLSYLQGSGENAYLRKFFFVKTEGTTSIRKTLKPVKISPKARYFDLLGRYKFFN